MSSIVPVRANGSVVIYSGWTDTPPTIDGVLETGEWDDAAMQAFTLLDWLGNPTTITGTVYMMNDATNLYIAIEVSEDDSDTSDRMTVFFDNNNDGTLDDDEDALLHSSWFYDMHWDGEEDQWLEDNPHGASGAKRVGSDWVFEFLHPLCSGDPFGEDFCLNLGDVVGFNLGFQNWVAPSWPWYQWPSINTHEDPIDDWGDIIIAQRPEKPSPIGGDVFSVDKLAILLPYLLVVLVFLTATSILIKKRNH